MNWEHLWTVLWLRSRLSRNQWRRAGRLATVIRVCFRVIGVLVVLAGLAGGFALGYGVLSNVPAWVTVLVVLGAALGFLFFWLIGMVAEIQRSEAIDLQRLLHLPVSLGSLFVINYLASLLTPAIILFAPMMLALTVGLSLSRGPGVLWMLPLGSAFLLAVTAWTYCVRGWVVSLMVNKRRRRAIVVGMTLGIIVLGQLPNLAFNNPWTRQFIRDQERQAREQRTSVSSGENLVGPRGVPMQEGLEILVDATVLQVPGWSWAGVSLMGFSLGALGLRRGYGMTLRFYRGDERTGRVRRKSVRAAEPRFREGVAWMERRLPACSEPVSAMTLAFLRSMLRAPETKMALVMPFVVGLVLGVSSLGQRKGPMPELVKPFLLTGIAAFAVFSVLQLASNVFGSDRNGFRALVLAPGPRPSILLAKNMALAPVALGVAVPMLGVMAWAWQLSVVYFVAGLAQFGSGYVLLCLVGNLCSVRAPFRVSPGSLKPTKNSSKTQLLVFAFFLLFPLAMLPLLLPPLVGLLASVLTPLDAGVATLLASIVLLAGCALGYPIGLRLLGRELQDRELRILEIVTSPVE